MSKTVSVVANLAVILTVTLSGSRLKAEFPQLRLEVVTSGELVSPVALANAGDGSNRLFAVDQRGTVSIIEDGAVLPTPFLDIESKLVPPRTDASGALRFDERGLLSLAFHPHFDTAGDAGEGKFYVYYSAPSPNGPGTDENPVDHRSVIAEYRVSGHDPNVADPTERILLTFDQPQFNHDGGQLAFGPDEMLYISTGDGGSSNDNNAGHTGGSQTVHDNVGRVSGTLGNAQDRTNLLGKVLRIDVHGTDGIGGEYGIPDDNPFEGDGGGVSEEIFAYGLRNPWRFSFDDGPGGSDRLFLADVGQGDVEEVDIIESGKNYGWRIKEGSLDFDSTATPDPLVTLVDPIAEYSRNGDTLGLADIAGVSSVGGYVYRGNEFPELVGKYIFADWSTGFRPGNGTFLGLEETSPDTFELSVLDVLGGNPIGRYITALGEDESGELYVVTNQVLEAGGLDSETGLPTGAVFKITVVPEPGSVVLLIAGALMALAVARWKLGPRREPKML